MNPVINTEVSLINAGLIDYKECWDLQEALFKKIIDIKIANRGLPENEQQATPNYFILCEHPHVYTLGKSGDENNMLIDATQLKENNASFYKINRGGDITYHGPGQIVGYPILDLDNFFTDIHKYLRLIEETIIQTLSEYTIQGDRYPGFTGVWLDPESPLKARKICAIGVRTSRWVTMHGFALNVNSNLQYFNNIVPCGINNKQVTSLKNEIHTEINLQEVEEKIIRHFSALFGCTIIKKKPALI